MGFFQCFSAKTKPQESKDKPEPGRASPDKSELSQSNTSGFNTIHRQTTSKMSTINEDASDKVPVKQNPRKLNKQKTNKVENEPSMIDQLEALNVEDNIAQYKASSLCPDCKDKQKQIKKKLKSMSSEDIALNVQSLKFEPCQDCKANAYMESPRGGQPSKSKQIQIREKEILKYIFVEPHEIDAREPIDPSLSQSNSNFIQYNLEMYHECKNDDTKINYAHEEKSYGYYIVSLEWMSQWRSFVNRKGSKPGCIDNSMLKDRIEESRERLSYPEDESHLGLHDKVHFYILSVAFFKFFYNAYGCNHIIQIKYSFVQERVEINPDALRESIPALSKRYLRSQIEIGMEANAAVESYTDL